MKLLMFEELKPSKGVPYCRDHLRTKVAKKEFPAPIPLSPGRIAWIEEEIDDWIAERAAEREGGGKTA